LTDTRVRPAVIVSAPALQQDTGDVILAMVTSQRHTLRTDYALLDWREAGLIHPSWVRAKLATLDNRLILHSPGHLSRRDRRAVRARLRLALDLQ
jgi:mRNA-degrading endonuclease toxin of MazEF toxin-antitoxin module